MLREALRRMETSGMEIFAIAPFIETLPVGFSSAHPFLNSAAGARIDLTPEELLDLLQEIERQMGRTEKTTPGGAYRDRVIDLDILLYDREVIQSDRLTIPHPRMLERLFVLAPLAQIAPQQVIPTSGKTVLEHLRLLRNDR